MDMFIPGVWDEPIKKYYVRTSVTMDYLRSLNRKGHSVPAQTDREWDQLRTERKRRYNAWKKLTDELRADGVLDHDACYECGGELILNKDRPTKWVWDESEEEFDARMKERS